MISVLKHATGRVPATLLPLLVAMALPSGGSAEAQLRGQEASVGQGEGRVMEDAEKDALRRWALQRLQEVEPGSDRKPSDLPHHPDLERLWALYFLSVEEKEWEKPAVALADSLARNPLPEDLHVHALGGAIEVVRAKNSRWPPNKLKHLRQGLSVLDRLVEEEPRDPAVRYLRLVSCYYLPFFLEREESVKEDFAVLASVLPDRGDAFSPQVRHAVLRFVLDKGEVGEPDRTRLEKSLEELGIEVGSPHGPQGAASVADPVARAPERAPTERGPKEAGRSS